MKKYKDVSPTTIDTHINFDDDREEWFVLGVSRTRDSEALTEANFQAALEDLGGESEFVEVHRFGHWGPGWFELILISPDATELLKKAEEIEASLESYPVLDDELFSQLEEEEAVENWKCWAGRSFVQSLSKVFDLSETTTDFLHCNEEKLYSFYRKNSPYSSTEFYFDFLSQDRGPSRSDIAKLILEVRKEE